MADETLSLVFTAIGATASLITAFSLILVYNQIKDDHERSRRESTVNVMQAWVNSNKQESSSARKLVEVMSEEDCRKIRKHEGIKLEINNEKKQKIKAIFPDFQFPDGETEIALNEEQCATLDYILVSYLNNLETVLAAWKLGTVDREMIEHEFSYLVNQAEGHQGIELYRRILGGERAYPSISDFIKKINEANNATPQNRNLLGRLFN